MSKQIVISGNRVLAHGEDCFAVTNNTVICTDSEKVYNNATIAIVDEWPADIDTVGYEYHLGAFIPCAPFGRGKGNLAVLCPEDCKSLKDSGIHIDDLNNVLVLSVYSPYTENEVNVTFDTDRTISAVIIISNGIVGAISSTGSDANNRFICCLSNGGNMGVYAGHGTISGNNVEFGCNSGHLCNALNEDRTITAIAFLS